MKFFSFTTVIVALLVSTSACQSNQPTQQPSETQSGAHKVIVQEVLQTSNYTYLRVKEGDSEQWLAVSKMEIPVGGTYYYENGLPMTDFESKELKRTFKIVLFLSNISSTPDMVEEPLSDSPHQASASSSGSNSNTTNAKQDVKITPAKGGITIATLFKDKQFYSGKTVRIKGKVTKYLAGIMNKNWIHLQDGTDNSGKFDLIATTNAEVKVGDLIILEGAITLNKDFGSGYFYEVIMEDAKIIK